VIAVEKIAITWRVPNLVPTRAGCREGAEKPVAILIVVEEDLRPPEAGEVSDPETMVAVEQVAEVRRAANLLPA